MTRATTGFPDFFSDDSVRPDALVEAVLATGFTGRAYRERNPDLEGQADDDRAAAAHLILKGAGEGRLFPIDLRLDALAELRRLPWREADDSSRLVSALGSAYVRGRTEGSAIDALEGHWPVVQALRCLGARPYFIVGDSHAVSYRRQGIWSDAWLLPLHLNCTGGSALGLGNPDSRSGYGERIRRFARAAEALPGGAELPVLLKFGQVDTEFVYQFRQIESGVRKFDLNAYRAFCDQSVASYGSFLDGLVPRGERDRYHVFSVFPPALSDDKWAEGYVNGHIAFLESGLSGEELSARIHRIEIPDLAVRTAMHRSYNERLERMAWELGFNFVDDFSMLLGTDGLIDERWIAESRGTDHHVDFGPTEAALVPLIWRCFATAPMPPPAGLRLIGSEAMDFHLQQS